MNPTIDDIRSAAIGLKGLSVRTPLLENPFVNERIGGRLLVKAEPLQRTGSFKFRGAYNTISNYAQAGDLSAVVAYSSGNHAQGVAAAAGRRRPGRPFDLRRLAGSHAGRDDLRHQPGIARRRAQRDRRGGQRRHAPHFREFKLVVEPGGAVALAAVLTGKVDCRSKTVCVVCSGGNVDGDLYADVLGGG